METTLKFFPLDIVEDTVEVPKKIKSKLETFYKLEVASIEEIDGIFSAKVESSQKIQEKVITIGWYRYWVKLDQPLRLSKLDNHTREEKILALNSVLDWLGNSEPKIYRGSVMPRNFGLSLDLISVVFYPNPPSEDKYHLDEEQLLYSSPELLTHSLKGVESDVWSFGMTVYKVIFSKLPFEFEYPSRKILVKHFISEEWNKWLEQQHPFFRSCFSYDLSKRPNCFKKLQDAKDLINLIKN
jgi:hypothetical protein